MDCTPGVNCYCTDYLIESNLIETRNSCEKGNSYPKTFLEEIFIDDTDNIVLKDNTSVEFSIDALDQLTIRDSSGKNNKGVVIGDYSISKPNKTIEVSKYSRMITPIV